ncbi:MAG: SRPBCC domain-containing protein [Hyphomonadaceae bacterium JAD_PAG50586_4]|nr:MAG: SRPBCC domain-containing protein [Hyphomonadaceae bacterium JAD_PAG50586_4]
MTASAASVEKRAFRHTVRVETEIAASPERIWALLTDASGMPRWNSTVSAIDGEIALGQKLAIRVPISPRTFTPTVTVFDPPKRMIWQDGTAPVFQGRRTFEIEPLATGSSRFVMTETFSGALMPMIGPSLPDFAPVFAHYAADLKRAAEAA